VSRSTASRIPKRPRARLQPPSLSTTITGGVAWLRLERPQAGNRITLELAQALCDAAAEIELDDSVVAVVLAAAGADFCLGVEGSGDWQTRVDWIKAIGNLTRPVIAAIQGDAFAEGFELALACDLRVVADRARFAMPQPSMGHLPTHGGTQRLPRIVGRMRALDLLLTGRMVDAADAEAMGLAARVVAPADFERTIEALVSDVNTKGPIALRFAKEAVLKGSDLSLEQGMRLEEDLYVLLQTTRDRDAGVHAFLEKRKPVFHGK
jgi:enoyl-CoA hydratase/carnithine racemase